MKFRLATAMALAAALAGCCAKDTQQPGSTDLSGLEELRIDYTWMGWGSIEEHFTVTPDVASGGFTLRGSYQGPRGERVEVEAPALPRDVATFIGLATSPEWTRAAAMHAVARRLDRRALGAFHPASRLPVPPCTDEELHRLARRHFGRTSLVTLVDDYYGRGNTWTDDYPSLVVQARWRDKPLFVMTSRSQKGGMLPWHMGIPAESPVTATGNWSVPLSASVQSLLPPASHAYKRLGGIEAMEQKLRGYAMYDAQRQCEKMRPRSSAASR
jgi:hypothetical protein